MKQKRWARGICLLLAVQLFVAPTVMAYSLPRRGSEQILSEGQVPSAPPELPEELPTDMPELSDGRQEDSQAPEGGAQIAPSSADDGGLTAMAEPPLYNSYAIGYGAPVLSRTTLSLAPYNGYLAMEVPGWMPHDPYGSEVYKGFGTVPYASINGALTVWHVFPSPERLGRYPDKMFDGWYLHSASVYGAEDIGIPSDWEFNPDGYWGATSDWSGTEWLSAPHRIPLVHYEPGTFDGTVDNKYDLYGPLGTGGPYEDGPRGAFRTDPIVSNYPGYPSDDYGDTGEVHYVARWVPSNKAAAAGDGDDGVRIQTKTSDEVTSPLTGFYLKDIAGDSLETVQPAPFSADEEGPYYFRVPEEVASIDLTFLAYEPYYPFHQEDNRTGQPPVAITVDGEPVDWSGSIIAPTPTFDGGTYTAENNPENPARSEWTLTGIPLALSSAGKMYTEIVVTVTAPDGIAQKTYSFYAQRLRAPALTMKPGNTPVGMIWRDTDVHWGAGEAAAIKKRAAEEYFTANHSFDPANLPKGPENQLGSVYKGDYSPRAWTLATGAVNYDNSAEAIVGYLDSAFQDPGIVVTDTQGQVVQFGTGSGEGITAVSRRIKLREVDRLLLSGIYDSYGDWREVYYKKGNLTPTESKDFLTDPRGADQIDLRGEKVLPGVYFIEYFLEDPLTGIEFKVGERPLIILPIPGDVDMDGAVTAADAKALGAASGGNTLNGVSLANDKTAALFAFRTADVVHNLQLDQYDESAIYTGFSPVLDKKGNSDYFYLPLPTGDPAGTTYHGRITVAALMDAIAPDQGEMAQLELRFLGVEKGEYSATDWLTTSASGPKWDGGIDPEADAVELGDTFWVGVHLSGTENSSLNSFAVSSFHFSLTYNNRYVEPAAVMDRMDYITGGGGNAQSEAEMWAYGLRYYNTAVQSRTIWGSNLNYSTGKGLNWARPFTPHYSRPITGLETSVAGGTDALRELHFAIEKGSSSLPQVRLQDGYLMVVPFRLLSHPYQQDALECIELGVGMRDFLLTSFSGGGGARAVLNEKPLPGFGTKSVMPAAVPLGDSGVVAYSAQKDIFGGNTDNLRDHVGYVDQTLSVHIPLGVDKTVATPLYNENAGGSSSNPINAVYGEPFTVRNIRASAASIVGELPPGLTYQTTGGFTGTPTKAGDYRFALDGTVYSLRVEKAKLRYYADSEQTYYGQHEFRGDPGSGFRFSYEKADIKPRDRVNEALLDGSGANLPRLLGDGVADDENYIPPTFRAVNPAGETIQYDSPIGSYEIKKVRDPFSTNYEFIFVDRPEGSGTRKAMLIVHQRPIRVVHLAKGLSVGKIFIDVAYVFSGKTAVLNSRPGEQRADFAIRLPIDEDKYNAGGIELSGDALVPGDDLEISYAGIYIRNDEDKMAPAGSNFALDTANMTETRPVEVTDVKLTTATATTGNGNYTLVASKPAANYYEDDGVMHAYVTGVVAKRKISKINILVEPTMTYTYGNPLGNMGSFKLSVEVEGDGGGGREEEFFYSEDPDQPCKLHKLQFSWATEEQKNAQQPGDMPFTAAQILNVTDHHGRYLCVYRAETASEPKLITYSKGPVTVNKRQLILTVQPIRRYYGEPNGEIKYTYDRYALSPDHYRMAKDTYGTDVFGDAAVELADILNRPGANTAQLGQQEYTAPTPTTRLSGTNATQVDEFTSVSSAGNAVVYLSGAAAANYSFVYKTPSGTSTTAGTAKLTIERRPIVVERINKTENLGFVYADTQRLRVYNGALTAGEFTLALPTNTTEKTAYFSAYNSANSSGQPTEDTIGFRAGATALLPGDSVGLSYTAVMVPERNEWHSFSNNYFLADVALYDVRGRREVDVEVRDMGLTGEKAVNYVLVYRTYKAANQCTPETVEKEITNGQKIPALNLSSGTYRVAGTGIVKLRAIQSINIDTVPNLKFIYGNKFDPTAPHPVTGKGLEVTVQYEKENDNYAGNRTSDPVSYRVTGVEDGTGRVITSFEEAGLRLCYITPQGDEVTEANYLSRELAFNAGLSVPEHNKARIVVAGRRSPQDDLVISKEASEANGFGEITVSPLQLALTAQNQWRYYGEGNLPAQFTFDPMKLAASDRQRLITEGLLTAGGTGNYTVSSANAAAALELIGGGSYEAPQFYTEATAASAVRSSGMGGYELTMQGGKADNYTIAVNPGTIYVLRRPITVSGINSSLEDPVYTIYQNTKLRVFYTTLSTLLRDGTSPRFNLGRQLYPADPAYAAATVKPKAPTGDGLVAGDQLLLDATVEYLNLPADAVLAPGQTVEEHVVSVPTVAINQESSELPWRNYVLASSTPSNRSAIGAIELRNIIGIEVLTPPDDLDYEYGEKLNLMGLSVEITYQRMEDLENTLRDTVFFRSKLDFESKGLYVRYAPPGQPLPETVDERNWMVPMPDDDAPAEGTVGWRPGYSGDHMSIAPTHDSQAAGRPFASNGMQLVVCGRLMGYDAVEPKMIHESRGSEVPVSISVHPRVLEYTASAIDKSYDGDRRGAGSVSLTNIFNETGVVDPFHPDGVTDVVYLATGAAYENRNSVRYTDFPDFKRDYADKEYTFTTGRWIPPASGELNGRLEVTSTGLTFTFVHENVRYAEPEVHTDEAPALPGSDYWATEQPANTRDGVWDRFGTPAVMPVEITKMTLEGPDRANYRWATPVAGDSWTAEVLRTTRDEAERGEAAAPYATIHKANRDYIKSGQYPQVEGDQQTNSVRLLYDVANLSGARDTNDHYDSESHLEYALQFAVRRYVDQDGNEVDAADIYWPEAAGDPIPSGMVNGNDLTAYETVRNWAGPDGSLSYQDTTYFGGEAVVAELPVGYVPDLAELPSELKEGDVRKGQIYSWFPEDPEFTVDHAAYPGGAAYPGYELYATTRTQLPRDTIVWPLVRVAETHNYYAGPAISSDPAITPALITAEAQAVTAKEAARRDYWRDPTTETLGALFAAWEAEQTAAGAVEAAAEGVIAAARQTAQARMDWEMEAATNTNLLPREDEPWPVQPPAAAVKTFTQRIDLVSVQETRSAAVGDTNTYVVPTLEAVWFTDHLDYSLPELFHVVVRNVNPTRYYGYYWDDTYSTALEVDDRNNPFSLAGPMEVEITRRDESGRMIEMMVTVNEDGTARIYADIIPPSGDSLRTIIIQPRELSTVLGAPPFLLTVEYYPADVKRKSLTWTTSNPDIVQVSPNGELYFVGVGTAKITATAYNAKRDSIPVTVIDSFEDAYPGSAFNPDYTGVLFELDETHLFLPEHGVTRGELAILLAKFYRAGEKEQSVVGVFPDIDGTEPYAEAVGVLTRAGVITGVDTGAFDGDRVATRAELVAMLARMLNILPDPVPPLLPTFLDTAPEDTWAWGYIAAMSRTGILNGTGNGYFAPGRELTRAEAAAFIARLIRSRLPDDVTSLIIPVDVLTDHWGYDAILRAVNSGLPPELGETIL